MPTIYVLSKIKKKNNPLFHLTDRSRPFIIVIDTLKVFGKYRKVVTSLVYGDRQFMQQIYFRYMLWTKAFLYYPTIWNCSDMH